jgi:hypothetical protein
MTILTGTRCNLDVIAGLICAGSGENAVPDRAERFGD